jgi:hypothetical protein
MKALREAQILPFPDMVKHARRSKKVIDNTVIRLQRQEAKRAAYVAAAKERERLAALNLKPLPWDTPGGVKLPSTAEELLTEEEESEGDLRPIPSDREQALVAFTGGIQDEADPEEKLSKSKRVRGGSNSGSNGPAPPKVVRHAATSSARPGKEEPPCQHHPSAIQRTSS